ncbi:glycoside hydrolase family 18 protein [Streptomyces nigrescens]|uniref:hypothetical protein n=1 Tax=Streptomyces nigrescens TaxID=1920 RepID=UPI002255E126|nr:hypothetical protein [Streptomyces libani]MCX5444378.1 hypothetical protein [Streptomyces libani]
MTGVSPMLGENDDHQIYNQAAALRQAAPPRHAGLLGGEPGRQCPPGALFKCTNIPQTPYEFSKFFSQYHRLISVS